MFSGLTNQVSSWMGTTGKGENEEKVSTPTEENPVIEKKESTSPTKPGGKLVMNVKSQIEGLGGWLGSSIPKLKRDGGTAQNLTDNPTEEASDQNQLEPVSSGVHNLNDTSTSGGEAVDGDGCVVGGGGDDDDNSSATGGADSEIVDSPTAEAKEGQFGHVQSKALAGAKSIGSFLYSAVNKAGKSVSVAGAKIKENIEKNSILSEFNKEQEAFAKSKNTATSLPPWSGCPNEETLKEECLSLSSDRRHFVRAPPVDFQFDYEVSYPIAMAIMEQDPNLEKMRYELVPKVISEEHFWRNYFYRISLICQANELSSQTTADESSTIEQGQMSQLEEEWEKELEVELQDYEVVNEHNREGTEKFGNDIDDDDIFGEDVADLK